MTVPRVSIITVNRDMAPALAITMDSVLGQDYPALDYIVIDGASHDGSRDLIAARDEKLAYWISEPDSSLYDAMNKGVAAARGDWVLFMNAGDRFAASDALSQMFASEHIEVDILYGDHLRSYPGFGVERLVPAEAPSVLPWRMFCSHQSLLMRRELLLDHPFRTDLLAADYEVLLTAYRKGRRFEYVNCVVALTATGGRSDTQRIRSLRERMAILRQCKLMTSMLALHYRWLLARTHLAAAAKSILPGALTAYILEKRKIGGLG
jgi:glycosyltransferase involved in cell wall biosynthesis